MKSFTLLSALAALGAVSASPTKSLSVGPSKRAGTLPQVSASGNAFWADGKRFYIRGIDYQPGGDAAGIDPLADKEICTRDIKKFKDLGVNTIRVYTVDNTANHDDCMKALDEAGIYLVVDVNTAKYSLNRGRADWAYLSYNAAYLQNVFATVSEFAQYDNTLAFFSGNEVISEKEQYYTAPYIKAVTRDIKAFIKARKLRQVPVGYSAADVDENRIQTAKYMNCGPDDVRSDFFAFNDYSWCSTSFTTSGWDKKVEAFKDYGLPLFLSEYGCIENPPRDFGEVKALMSSDMTGVYSGGLMYEYSYEANKYGIVNLSGEKGQGDAEERDEYDSFKKALKDNPAPTGDGGASKQSKSQDCPGSSEYWDVDATTLPAMPTEAEKYMKGTEPKGAGLDTKEGSQTDGDSGLSTKNVTLDGVKGGNSSSSGDDGDSAAVAMHGSAFTAVLAVVAAVAGTTLL